MVPHSTIPGDVDDITHFTDLSRKILIASSHLFQPSASQLYSAIELKEAGVKIEVNKNSKCLLDLEISGHTLRIPFTRFRAMPLYQSILSFSWIFLSSQKGIIENLLGDSYHVLRSLIA
ncbi:hypothetical protein S245_058263 [Arachis hypogaea]